MNIHSEIQDLIDRGLVQLSLGNGFQLMLSLTPAGEPTAQDELNLDEFLEKAERDLTKVLRHHNSEV